jgi:hypothetical protein
MICNSETKYYFSKTYLEHPFDKFMRDVGPVDYYKCTSCGFVFSKTHLDLAPDRWAALNSQCHHYFEDQKNEKKGNQPPYAEQSMMLMLLGSNQIVDIEDMIDYAAGYGTLSRMLEKYFQVRLPIFDPYIQNGDKARYIGKENLRKYKTVINSAMFEHVLRRDDLDHVNDLADSDGCLILHTLVCETVPEDPDWFYLRPPVHTAFHTNKSMGILMNQWGYRSSIYCPKSKCWVLLKRRDATIEDRIRALNEELQSDWFYYKDGFMDYWKGF